MAGLTSAKEQFKNSHLLSRYRCQYCGSILRDAVQATACGHLFCETCSVALLTDVNPVCPTPTCKNKLRRDEDTVMFFPDKFVRMDMDAVAISCPRRRDNCTWKGSLSRLETHLAECKHSVRMDCKQPFPIDPKRPLKDEKSFACPFSKIGCDAGSFESLAEVEAHVQDDELAHDAMITLIICKLDSLRISRPPAAKDLQAKDTAEVASLVRKPTTKNDEIAELQTSVYTMQRSLCDCMADSKGRELRISSLENASYDGTLTWKIGNFSHNWESAKSGKYPSIFSMPFYTGRFGYKMCLRMYMSGDGIGKGSYMSLFFVIMRGEFDTILKWPFHQKVSLIMLNQGTGSDVVDTFTTLCQNSSFSKPISNMNIATGCPRFVSHEHLWKGQFIVDNSLFVKCIITKL